ncbi:hypothetical protein H5996_01320 [Faecalicoccus pleomorphus]|uniref:hypothetical protein n=1 Tax=Faecalicoccus pleomorphus TaxID=1323 RepID=UPI0019613A87|nr:hypothetical protein [Faecalicoccus pleomorphus]MBM6764545.1 hypothetical protein [Faecalicoccus pleomorphus]
MDVQIKITADDKALEFSRNLSNFYANLVVSGFVADQKKETITKVDKIADVEKPEEPDRPWETIEPDPIKMDEAPKEEPAKKYTTEEIRAAGADYIKRKGKPAFKVLLTQYNINKLTELPEDKYSDFMEDCDNAR